MSKLEQLRKDMIEASCNVNYSLEDLANSIDYGDKEYFICNHECRVLMDVYEKATCDFLVELEKPLNND